VQTFTGREYLKIDIANNFGLDKKQWDERIAWFDENEADLHNLINKADEPALFYAGIKAWEDVKAGNPIGYMISLDATSSGLQLLAALTSDRKAAKLCNVVNNGDQRMDAYTAIYGEMLGAIGESSKISRDQCKDAIMTAFYGSTAMPKQIFGEGALLDTFYATMKSNAPAAWELNQAFLAMWDPEAIKNSWVLPDNFHVHVKIMSQVKESVNFLNQPFDVFYNVNAPMEEGRSLSANTTHSVDGMVVREMVRRCNYDPQMVANVRYCVDNADGLSIGKATGPDDDLVLTLWDHYTNTGYLSARILQHLNMNNIGYVDAAVIRELLDSLPDKPFKVISIHDCFRCLPHYGNDLRKQYNLQLQLIAKSNLLGSLISQIVGKTVHIGKLDPNLHVEILDSNYALS
jgi:hypothetical protein